MNKIITLILVFGLVSIVWAIQDNAGSISPEQHKAIEQEILNTHREIVKAAENLDADALYKYVLDKCKGVIVQDGRIMMTHKESLETTKQGLEELKDISYKFNRKNITLISPTLALWIADGTTSVTTMEEQQFTVDFAETIFFIKKDGQWKIFHAHRSMPNPQ